MNLFARNSPYYELLKYLLFILNHPVYILHICKSIKAAEEWGWPLGSICLENTDLYLHALQSSHAIKADRGVLNLEYYLLTPRCRVLLEQLTGLQLVKKFPAFHGTRRFITTLKSVRHLSLSLASPIQPIYPQPTSWRSILILFTHLRLGLPSGLLPSGFPTKILYTHSPHPYAPHAQPISFFSILSPAQYWVSSTNHLAP